MQSYTKVLTIAGSDSGGGAGIQADLKTFAACGCYGMSAITAITVQNTCGVTGIHGVPVATITAQIRAVLDDIGTDAVKIGMLHSEEIIVGVAAELNRYHISNIILDPVMVATSGDRLIRDDAVDSLKKELFSMARLITPNIPEAEILSGTRISDSDGMMAAARDLGRQYAVSVLVKGGHLADRVLVDVLWDNELGKISSFENPRIATNNSHGTGCTLSSAIAAFAAKGKSMADAVAGAEQYLHAAILAGARFVLGKGNGPVHHFHKFW